jgi:glycosyltransferase involved in cell wall biosynthesis
MNIYVNGRFRSHQTTGVQRVAHEITRRLGDKVEICQPQSKLSGWRGHLWEQTVLPLQSREGVLWSPCASGPVRSARHVVTFHDLFVVNSPHWYQAAYAAWHAFSLRQLAATASHIIAVSEYTRKCLIEHLATDPAKITVIHNGVDANLFSAARGAESMARAALRLPSARYLLSVGSLEPRKNLKMLLAAWKDVVNELPSDLWLVVSGSCDENIYRNAELKEWPARVFLTGYVPDHLLPSLYAGSSGFIYPSLAEGFGLPPLEAMACGVPVLTSGTSALPEICSSAALYFDPTNTADLARAIKLLVSDQELRRKLSLRGRERAACFNWERTAEQTLHVLRTIAASRHCVIC